MASVFPFRAEAIGFGDILSALGRKPIVVEDETKDLHSQNIPILRPVRSVDPENVGGGDIQVSGGTALVADTGPLGTIADVVEGNKTGSVSTYIVEKGDTIGEIAQQFNVSVNTIKWANDIKGNSLKVGQELVILPVTGIKYTVKNGGSIRDIVKKYGGDATEAARFNGVGEDEDLKQGTVVIIPDATEMAMSSDEPKKGGSRLAVRPIRTSALHGAGGPAYPGYYVHPLNGLGVKTQGLHGYNAIDIGTPVGTPVIASASGTVVVSRQVAWNGGYGAYVVIQHDNDSQTLYAHLSENDVSLGQRVSQGQQIGLSGSTGKSTGPHLHFEVRGAKNPF